MTRWRVLHIPLGIYCFFNYKNNIFGGSRHCVLANTDQTEENVATCWEYCRHRICDECVLDMTYFKSHQEEFLIDEIND